MKKTLTKRTGVLLLALVMLTSCFVGGTFAKYVTSMNLGGNTNGTNNDGSYARVAKWGVTIEGVETNTDGSGKLALFDDQYATDDTTSYSGTWSVDSADSALVVAPGTGSVDKDGNPLTGALSISLKGQPEVATKITVKAGVTLGGTWELDGTFYCPLIFYVGDQTVNGTEFNTKEALSEAISKAVATYTMDPNADLADLTDGNGKDDITVNIGWCWPFHVSDAQDIKDTKLGDAAAAAAATEGGSALSVSVSGSVSVEQID